MPDLTGILRNPIISARIGKSQFQDSGGDLAGIESDRIRSDS
ncbi:unnamed protein product, partial [Didymodactylos carnosus]